MAPDDDDAYEYGEYDDLREDEPASGPRAKRSPSAMLQLYLADFRRRAEGLEGSDLEREITRLLERMLEAHVGTAPAALREGLREHLSGMLMSDPTLGDMVDDLRRASGRSPR